MKENKCPVCNEPINSENVSVCGKCGLEAPVANGFVNDRVFSYWRENIKKSKSDFEKKQLVNNTKQSAQIVQSAQSSHSVQNTQVVKQKTPVKKKVIRGIVIGVVASVATFIGILVILFVIGIYAEKNAANNSSSGTSNFNSNSPIPESIVNKGSSKIEVWSDNSELLDLINGAKVDGKSQFGPYTNIEVDYTYFNDSDKYREALDEALAAGTGPDLFSCDSEYAQIYMNSDNTKPIKDIGLDDSIFNDMFDYTVQYAKDDNDQTKGLTWQCCVGGVFYNRSLAQQYLGVSEPEDVQKHFSSWDQFYSTAEKIKNASNGEVKMLNNADETWVSYKFNRNSDWIKKNNVDIDKDILSFLDFSLAFETEGLSNGILSWTDKWLQNADNRSTFAYFGPMWLGNYVLPISNSNSATYGDWGFVGAPTPYFWGGTWLMVSNTCDRDRDAAQIMYDLCLDITNLSDYASKTGEFVNSHTVMESIANDSSFSLEWLGGQNPAEIMVPLSSSIDASHYYRVDQAIDRLFLNAVDEYVYGGITQTEAIENFKNAVKENDYC